MRPGLITVAFFRSADLKGYCGCSCIIVVGFGDHGDLCCSRISHYLRDIPGIFPSLYYQVMVTVGVFHPLHIGLLLTAEYCRPDRAIFAFPVSSDGIL